MKQFFIDILMSIFILIAIGFLLCIVFPLGYHLVNEWNSYLDKVLL